MSSIKDQIRQEIERRKKKRMNEDLPISIGRYYEDRDLLSFIDSLPECEETAKIPSEKYEEEINNEIQGFIDEYGYERGEDKILIAIVARHFAEWQKEQMMKEAVDGTVHHVKAVHYIITNQDQLTKRLKQFEEGDKVKIIIVKQ